MIRRWLDGAERLCTLAAVAATFVMMVLTTADAGGRYLLNRPILAAYEVTTNYLMVLAVFLALPYGYRTGANVRVTFLVERLRGPFRMVIDHVVQVLAILYCGVLVVATFRQAQHIRVTGTTLTIIETPQWPGYLVVSVGLFVTSILMLFDLREVRKGRSSLFMEGQGG